MNETNTNVRFRMIAVLAACALALGVGPVALAGPGPDPDVGSFSIFTDELGPGGAEYDRTFFDVSQGWDWGLRAAYSCAYVEYFQGGQLLFEVHYELVADYPTPTEINDTAAAGEPVNGTLGPCGDGIGPEANVEFDGSDHFPHGTAFEFYRDGQQVITLDYMDNMCANGYWTPGDEPGEAWLWWDVDGPQDTMPGMGDCTGGPAEPQAVVRAYVQNRAPNVGVCVLDMLDGDMCVNRFPPPTITTLSPTSGAVGSSVTITGTGFVDVSSVRFSGVAAVFTVNSSTQITAIVPVATSGPVTVITPDGTATSAASFQVTTPTHERRVTLRLPGNRAKGTVSVSDGFSTCASRVPVNIQREVNGSWNTVASVQTGANGKFKVGGIGQAGSYRAFVKEVTIGSDICMKDRSKVARQ
jgi:hypothetical protein